MGIKSYNPTPGLNVDVGGVAGTEIDEGDDPAALNNATRQILADLASDLISGGDFVWELQSGGALVRVQLDAPFDGVTQTFNMLSVGDLTPVTVGSASQVRAMIGGARQEPDINYGVSGSAISFFDAPLASDEFFILAATGEITTPVKEYLLWEDGFKRILVKADPSTPAGQPAQELEDGNRLLEPNTP